MAVRRVLAHETIYRRILVDGRAVEIVGKEGKPDVILVAKPGDKRALAIELTPDRMQDLLVSLVDFACEMIERGVIREVS